MITEIKDEDFDSGDRTYWRIEVFRFTVPGEVYTNRHPQAVGYLECLADGRTSQLTALYVVADDDVREDLALAVIDEALSRFLPIMPGPDLPEWAVPLFRRSRRNKGAIEALDLKPSVPDP